MKKFTLLLFCIFWTYATTIERDTLSNGLVILTVEAHRIPMIEMKVMIHAGSVFDPQGKQGLSNLVSEMLLRGTENRTADEIVESIEFVGGELSSFADEDYAGLNCKVLSKDLYLLINLLSDCLQNPLFDSLEFSWLKRKIISGIKTRTDDPFEVSEIEFRKLIFNDHPLGHFPEGFESSVTKILTSDLKEFYDKYYLPNNTFMVFVGDFEKDSLMLMLNEKFGNWERRKLQRPEIRTPIESTKSLGKIVHMDISQAYILMGNLGPKYGTTDWYETRVMNYILGGAGMTSRISEKIREEKGLAYIVFSYFRRFKTGGYFTAEVQTRKEMVNEVVQTLIDEMRKMQDTIDVVELARAKKFYTGYFPMTHDTYHGMTKLVAQIEIEHLGLDYPSQFEKFIDAVRMDKLKSAAQKHLHPDRLYLLIVGDIAPGDIKVEGIEWLK